MSDPLAVASPATASILSGVPAATSAPTPAKIHDLAAQFEGILLSQMMKDLKSAMVDDGGAEDGFDASPLGDTLTSELGLALSRAGGFGMANALSGAIARQAHASGSALPTALPTTLGLPSSLPVMPVGPGGGGGGGQEEDEAGEDAPVPMMLEADGLSVESAAPDPNLFVAPLASMATSAVAPTPVSLVTPVAPASTVAISSGFGWRTDPIAGDLRFHKGVDLPLAQGTTVRSAISGRVRSVGEESGYGLTVVVANDQGLETRYAHLSAATVSPGAAVTAGDVVARSGNTGRTTGAHLHFEVLAHGQAVNPLAWVGAVVGPGAAPQGPTRVGTGQ